MRSAASSSSARSCSTLLSKPAFAISTEATRYYLNGILLHDTDAGLAAVATDGHRLARVILPGVTGLSQDRRLIVPKPAIKVLVKLLADKEVELLTLRRSASLIEITSTKFTFISKLIDAEYPAYERLVSASTDNTAILDRAALVQAVARVAAVVSDDKRLPLVGLTWKAPEQALQLCVPDAPEIADDPIEAEVSGRGRLAVQVKHLAQLLDETRKRPHSHRCRHQRGQRHPDHRSGRREFHDHSDAVRLESPGFASGVRNQAGRRLPAKTMERANEYPSIACNRYQRTTDPRLPAEMRRRQMEHARRSRHDRHAAAGADDSQGNPALAAQGAGRYDCRYRHRTAGYRRAQRQDPAGRMGARPRRPTAAALATPVCRLSARYLRCLDLHVCERDDRRPHRLGAAGRSRQLDESLARHRGLPADHAR